MKHNSFEKITIKKGDKEVVLNNIKEVAEGLDVTPTAVYYAIKGHRKLLGWEVIGTKKEFEFRNK